MMKRQEIRAYIILCLRAHSSASRFKKTLFFLFQSAAKKADLCAANQSLQHIFLPPCAKSGPIPHQNIDKSRFSNYDGRVSNRRRNEHHGSIDDG